jgi:hypothetical protein
MAAAEYQQGIALHPLLFFKKSNKRTSWGKSNVIYGIQISSLPQTPPILGEKYL